MRCKFNVLATALLLAQACAVSSSAILDRGCAIETNTHSTQASNSHGFARDDAGTDMSWKKQRITVLRAGTPCLQRPSRRACLGP